MATSYFIYSWTPTRAEKDKSDISCIKCTIWLSLLYFKSIEKTSVANNIRRLREEKGILQKEVATEGGEGVSCLRYDIDNAQQKKLKTSLLKS